MTAQSVLLGCLSAGAMLAAGQTPQAVPAAPAQAPAQAYVIEHLITTSSWQNNGTGWRETQAVVQVQSAAGVKQLAVLSFPFIQGDESVSVAYVRVRQKDGTVVATPAYNIRAMPAEISRIAPMYSDLMEEQVVVKGLDVGDTLEYEWRVREVKPLVPGQFWFAYDFQRTVECKDEQLTLDVPADREVTVTSGSVTPATTVAGGRKIYHWRTSNATIVKVKDPTALPPPPAVEATTFRSWAEVGAWYNQLQAPQLAVSPAIRAKAEELTQGLTSDEAKIQALYAFVAEHIHYVSLSFGIGRYQPHPADDVLSNGYGDCKDKHTLLASLLRAAGYTAYPALVNTDRALDPQVASPGQFDHVVTVVELNGKQEWLDATAEVAPSGWLAATLRGNQALLARPVAAALIKIPEQPPQADAADFQLTGALSAEGTLTAHVTYTLTGDSAVLMRAVLRMVQPAKWPDAMQAAAGFMGLDGKLSDVQVSGIATIEAPLTIRWQYKETYSNWSNQDIQPPLPLLSLPPWNQQGQATVLGSGPHRQTARATITLPPGYGLTPTPPVAAISGFATYRSQYSFSGNQYSATRSLVVFKKAVPAEDKAEYEAFTKTVQGDTDVWTVVTPSAGLETPAQHGRALMSEGWAQYRNGQFATAAKSLRQSVQLDPKNNSAWNDLGLADLMQRRLADAADDFQHAIAADANDPFAHNNLARVYMFEHRYSEAEAEFQKQIAINAEDPYAHTNLGNLLLQQKKPREAVAELTIAVSIEDTASNEYDLGEAELALGDHTAAIRALEAAADKLPLPAMQNNVAYALADAGVELPKAQALSTAAVAKLEGELGRIQLDTVTPAQLFDVHLLGMSWDTLGWIYFKQGNTAKAQEYIAAAWNLGGDPVEGDHLGQVYEKEGRAADAIHLYAEVGCASGSAHATQRLAALAGGKNAAESLCSRHVSDTSSQRTVRLPRVSQGNLSVPVLLSFGPGAVLREIRPAGSKPIPPQVAKALNALKYPIVMPKDATAMIREGIVSCEAITAACEFVLLPSGSAHLEQ